jgi:cell wall-associated NlpC family hydrolase
MKKIYAILVVWTMSLFLAQATVKTVKYKIKDGETLYIIAHKHHTTIEEVRKVNDLKKGEILKIGRVLIVPENTYFPNKQKSDKIVYHIKKRATTHRFVEYHIQKGETLYTIAHKHHTTIEEVRKANGLKKGEILKIGRVLKVPTNTYRVCKTKLIKITSRKKRLQTTYKINKKSSKIILLAKKKLGRRYVWGATGQKNTFDCSGFTKYVYQKNGIHLPRRAIAQSKYGKYIPRNKLQKGDLIFFDTSKHRRGYVNHVGIYIGNGKFIHASSAKKKVVITSLHKRFYSQRYKGARRPS